MSYKVPLTAGIKMAQVPLTAGIKMAQVPLTAGINRAADRVGDEASGLAARQVITE